MNAETESPPAESSPKEIAEAVGKILSYLRTNEDGGEYPLNSWLLGEIGYSPHHPLHKETNRLEKEVIDYQPNIQFKYERRDGKRALFIWFIKTPRPVKKRKVAEGDGIKVGNEVNPPTTGQTNMGTGTETRNNGSAARTLMIKQISKKTDEGNGEVMGEEKSSDSFVDRALDTLKKRGGRVTLKDLAKALDRKKIAGAELGRLRDAAMSHPNVNSYKVRLEGERKAHTELEWVKKATTREWVKTAYGKNKTQQLEAAPKRAAAAPAEKKTLQSSVSLMSVKFGSRKGEEANDLDLLLTTIKENVQQANNLRDGMVNGMLQKERQAVEALKRRKELIENARGLKIEASQARKDASKLGRQLRQAEKKMATTFSQMKDVVRPRR